jgi:hypothetical protein
MTGPRVLDLFSCAGGAGWGYHLAGFEVDGCDLADRPHYPFPYHRGDALDHLAHLIATGEIARYALVHASPPCQAGCALTVGTNASQGWGGTHEDLVAPLAPFSTPPDCRTCSNSPTAKRRSAKT